MMQEKTKQLRLQGSLIMGDYDPVFDQKVTMLEQLV